MAWVVDTSVLLDLVRGDPQFENHFPDLRVMPVQFDVWSLTFGVGR